MTFAGTRTRASAKCSWIRPSSSPSVRSPMSCTRWKPSRRRARDAQGERSTMIIEKSLERLGLVVPDLEQFYRTNPSGAKFVSHVAVQNVLYLSRSEEHTSELQSRFDLVCRLLLEKK